MSAATDVVLSKRQAEVLTRIEQGMTNKEIGDELGISQGTVKIHVSKILATLDVKRRQAAASIAGQSSVTLRVAAPPVGLRDQFAMSALSMFSHVAPPEAVAKHVYAIADAMLAERSKSNVLRITEVRKK